MNVWLSQECPYFTLIHIIISYLNVQAVHASYECSTAAHGNEHNSINGSVVDATVGQMSASSDNALKTPTGWLGPSMIFH